MAKRKLIDPMTAIASLKPDIEALLDKVHKVCDQTGSPDAMRIMNRLQSADQIAWRYLNPAPVQPDEDEEGS
jgi:hypothetical protein